MSDTDRRWTEPEQPEEHEEHQEHDDEDEEESFEEPFSLLQNVVGERSRDPTAVESYFSVEVIHHRGPEIVDLLRADPGQTVRTADGFHLLTLHRHGGASLYFRTGFKGTLVTHAKPRRLARLCTDRFACSHRDPDLFGVSLAPGDYAQVLRGDEGYLVRFVRPPIQPAGRRSWRLNPGHLQILAGSAAVHLMVLLLLGFSGAEADLTVNTEREAFAAAGTYRLPALEKPEQKVEVQQQPAPAEPSLAKTKVRPIRPTGLPSASSAGSKAAQQKRQVRSVFKALENLRPSTGMPGRSDLSALTSSIAAVRSPSAGGFKIAGVVGKVGGGLRLSGGGRGGAETRTIGPLLTGPGGGTGQLVATRDTGYHGARGRVTRAPKRHITVDGSMLDKEKIQRVVNQHMSEIQRCYEVQLLSNPGLQGKMTVDWTISPSGGVSTARLLSSTLPSPAVATCVLAHVRTWRFPPPTGGAVQVRYPFVFRVRGF